MAGEQHRMGLISKEEASTGENRHVLTRSLGAELFVAADTVTVNVIPGDVLVLSSDGLHDLVSDEQLEQILVIKKDLDSAAKTMIEAAKKAGGHDNVSVQIEIPGSIGGADGFVPPDVRTGYFKGTLFE